MVNESIVQRIELLKNAKLDSPFEESCLKGVCEVANKWLAEFDMTGIE